MISIQLIKNVATNDWWIALLRLFLQHNMGESFSIHCWNEETYFSDLALQYGKLEQSAWEYGSIIKGEITQKFVDFISEISLDVQQDNDLVSQKMTPFFNIILGDSFFSAHYGQEVQLVCDGQQLHEVQNIIEPLLQRGLITAYQN